MSRITDKITVDITKEESLMACRNASAKMNWKVLKDSDYSISIKSRTGLITWPVTIDIIISNAGHQSVINLNGSCFGYGPIQSSNVENEISILKNKIFVEIDNIKKSKSYGTKTEENIKTSNTKSSSKVKCSDFVDKMEKYQKLYANSILTKEEYSNKKKILISDIVFNNIEESPEDFLTKIMDLKVKGILEQDEFQEIKSAIL